VNKIYLCNNNNINKFIDNNYSRYNDNIIITKSYLNFSKLKNLYELITADNNYLEIILYNYIKNNLIDYEQIFIDYKLVLSRCNIIAIAGDSGSGKSTLLKELNSGNYQDVPNQLARWVYAAHKVLPALVTRRTNEALFFTRPVPTSESA
jgi:ABC-type phosphate transport system ATPase subunit